MRGPILDFEKPLAELESQIEDMRSFADGQKLEVRDELSRLEEKAEKLRRQIYGKLNRWQQVQLARHPARPYTLDYIERIFEGFVEFHGDRLYRDDPAIVGEWPSWAGNRSWSSGIKRAVRRRRTSTGTSACRIPRVTGRLSASWRWPHATGVP